MTDAETNPSNAWLVRTATNFIYGPYSKNELLELIRGGRFSLQDEVCASGGYWFFLNERNEVENQLGIEITDLIPRGVSEDEVTKTVFEPRSFEPSVSGESGHTSAFISTSTASEEEFGTRVMSSSSRTENFPEPIADPPPSWFVKHHVWKAITWFLSFCAFFILFVVIKKLRR